MRTQCMEYSRVNSTNGGLTVLGGSRGWAARSRADEPYATMGGCAGAPVEGVPTAERGRQSTVQQPTVDQVQIAGCGRTPRRVR